ncbi:MAG: transcriptional regulator [Planctomycetes bacterium]|nr:transcriptional regulator [Planctomycetota bacterium]
MKVRPDSDELQDGAFAYEGLDRALHEKARLGMLTALLAHPDGLGFVELRALCDLTDGNLNRHVKVLVDAQLVTVRKHVAGGRRRTTVRLTARGRTSFLRYLDELERVIRDARDRAAEAARDERSSPGTAPA